MEQKQERRGLERERWQQAAEGYFSWCDGTRERTELKNGGYTERQVPYTLYGLSARLGLSPKELVAIAHGEKGARWKQKLLSQALCRIAAYIMERALLGELSYQVALSALKELEHDKTDSAPEGLTVTMEAGAEVYSR